MKTATVFRPKSNLIWGSVALVFDATFVFQAVAYPRTNSNLLFDVTFGVVVAIAIVLLWFKPKLILEETTLIVVNPIKTEVIAYKDITSLDTKWALLINHGNKATRVWVAPANGKQRWITDSTQRWKFDRMPTSQKAHSETTTASQSLSSDSGIAANLIKTRAKHLH